MQLHQTDEQSTAPMCNRRIGGCPLCGSKTPGYFLAAPDRFLNATKRYVLVRCPECQLVWLTDSPDEEDMSRHYGPDYDAFIKRATDSDDGRHWQGVLKTLAKFKQGGVLLDIGCGSGSFLASLNRESWELCGIEMSEASAYTAWQRTGAQVFTGDILDAPFLGDRFDAITCLHVLEHVYDPVSVMTAVWGWLKPGGVALIQVPNIDAAERLVFRSFWYPLELPRHLYHFSRQSMAQLAQRVGFEQLSAVTHNVSFLEYSTRYIWDVGLRRLGIDRPALARAPLPGFFWRLIRKGLRMCVFPIATSLIGCAGEGQILEVVLRKPCETLR